jgi:hypothetical protein
MKKALFGFSQKQYWIPESVSYASAQSVKYYNNFFIFNLEDNASFKRGGHVRALL